jgi:hydroxymethylpyrimidine/phosphomethylpyrimidine kinase
VHALHPVAIDVLRAQLATIPWNDLGAVRVGALPSREAVHEVTAALAQHPDVPTIVDPVFSATAGGRLTDDDAWTALRDELATLPNVILTPNMHEAALLLGTRELARDDLAKAANALRERGALAVLVKGGHLAGDPADAFAAEKGVDVFVDERLIGDMRGTGCTLAMALACELARGEPMIEAVRSARAYVREKISIGKHFGGLGVAY